MRQDLRKKGIRQIGMGDRIGKPANHRLEPGFCDLGYCPGRMIGPCDPFLSGEPVEG